MGAENTQFQVTFWRYWLGKERKTDYVILLFEILSEKESGFLFLKENR